MSSGAGLSEAVARRRGTIALLLLALAMAVSSAEILLSGDGQTFFADEWNFMVYFRSFEPEVLLHSWGGHLVAGGLLVFNVLFTTVGTDNHLPYDVAALVPKLVIGALVYVLAKRRIGELWALAPAVLVLFLGAGWEVASTSFGLPNEIGLATGLGVLACLDRGDLRGDVCASVLLFVSLGSFSISVLIAAGAAVELTMTRRNVRWRRAWVYLIPLAFYAAWWVWARHFHDNQIIASNLFDSPLSMGEELAAICAGITGVFKNWGASDIGDQLGVSMGRGAPLAALLVIATVARFRHSPGPGPRAWALITILLMHLFATAMVLDENRVADASRYVWLGSVLVLLLLVQLASGLRWRPGAQAAVAAVFAFSLTVNIIQLHLGGSYFRQEGEYNRASVAALELVRDRVAPDFIPEKFPNQALPHPDISMPALILFAVFDRYGSPAYSPAELAAAPDGPRDAADVLMARALEVRARPARDLRRPAGGIPAPEVRVALSARLGRSGSCVSFRPRSGSRAIVKLVLPAGGFSYRARGGAALQIALARFGDGFAVRRNGVPAVGAVRIPSDRSARPWRVALSATAPVDVCPLAAT